MRCRSKLGDGRELPAIVAWTRPRQYLVSQSTDKMSSRVSAFVKKAIEYWTDKKNFGQCFALSIKNGGVGVSDTLQSIAALLTLAKETEPSGFPGEPDDGIFLKNITLLLEHNGISVVSDPSCGVSEGCRRIPVKYGVGPVASVSLQVPALKKPVPLGLRGPVSQCVPGIIDAGEGYDWFAWSNKILSKNPISIALSRMLTECGCGEMEWEILKGRLLDLQATASRTENAEAFALAWDFFLAWNNCSEKQKADGTNSPEIIAAFNRAGTLLRKIAVEILIAIDRNDSADLEELFPPRLTDGCRAGEIDLLAWRSGPWRKRGNVGIILNFRKSGSFSLRECAGASERNVEVMLPVAYEGDLALLNAPGVFRWNEGFDPPSYVERIHEAFRAGVEAALQAEGRLDFTRSLSNLKKSFESDNGCDDFNHLVTDAISGDSVAGGGVAAVWLDLLKNDHRFGFSCYPNVDCVGASGRWNTLSPSQSDKFLQWEFSDIVPTGQDCGIRYAFHSKSARRTISRGPSCGEGLQCKAAEITKAFPDGAGRLGKLAKIIERSSDMDMTFRQNTFGPHLKEGVSAAVDLLELIAAVAEPDPGVPLDDEKRNNAFRMLTSWLRKAGAVVSPPEWSFGKGSPAPPDGVNVTAAFDYLIPKSNILVKNFQVSWDGNDWPFSGIRSAGPPPESYEELRKVAAPSPDGTPLWNLLLGYVELLPEKELEDDLFRALQIAYQHVSGLKKDEKFGVPGQTMSELRTILESMLIKKYNVRFFPDKKTVDIKDLLPNEVAWADGRAILSGRVQVKARGMKSSEGDVVFPATLTEEEHQ